MIRYAAFLFGMTLLTTASADEPETIVYRVVASHEVLLDVRRTDAPGLRPTIFFIHGGALIMGHRGWVIPRPEYFLTLGYGLS